MTRRKRDVLSVEWIKLELLRTAYATRGGFFAGLDPRVVVGWYVLLAVVPWLTHDLTTLVVLFAVAALAVPLARVGPLVLGLFLFGLVTESIWVLALAWWFDGDLRTVMSLLTLTLKLGTISMASMAAFVSLDPEKLSNALVALRAPAMLSFGVSYGYRMLPILLEEFHTIVNGYRLRSAPPGRPGLLGWRRVVGVAVTIVHCFYPMILNTAKRTRTTVEALEARGFTFAGESPLARRVRLQSMRIGPLDLATGVVTIALVGGAFALGAVYPLYARDF